MKLKAFLGLLPRQEFVTEVAAVPYDVVDTREARELAAGHPLNLLHVDRAEIDLPNDADPYGDAVYETAQRNFQRLIAEGVLVRETSQSIYLYQQEMNGRRQTGVLAACSVQDYADDIIRKHEKTRKVKEDDRTRLVDALSAHTGPIFLTFRDQEPIQALIDATLRNTPHFDFTAADGVAHRLWRVEDPGAFVTAFGQVPLAYVADGHHRSASAWRVGTQRAAANPHHDGSEDYNWFLGVLFPASHLQILPYNRLVLDLNGHTAAGLLEQILAAGFSVTPAAAPTPDRPGNVHLYLGGTWHRIGWDAASISDPVKSLDVSVLQDRILAPLLGIDDPRTNDRIEFVGGIRGTAELERRVDSGAAAAAFSLFPVTVEQLMAIADAGEIMPPKSTWFEPKLRSGLVIQTF
ncbi:MAG: DUF1015 domain-containing protein [Verrucomicrobiales bacterium]|nr:DUF1015 domain-containing protein [Verrucomicrobiales bacterium]